MPSLCREIRALLKHLVTLYKTICLKQQQIVYFSGFYDRLWQMTANKTQESFKMFMKIKSCRRSARPRSPPRRQARTQVLLFRGRYNFDPTSLRTRYLKAWILQWFKRHKEYEKYRSGVFYPWSGTLGAALCAGAGFRERESIYPARQEPSRQQLFDWTPPTNYILMK